MHGIHSNNAIMNGESIRLQNSGPQVWKKKLYDLPAIQKKIDWVIGIQNQWYQKWKELVNEIKPFEAVWEKNLSEKNCLGRILNCSKNPYADTDSWGVSIDWIRDDENGLIRTTPNSKLPLLIGTLTPKGDSILEKRIRRDIPEIPERPDLIQRYLIIEKHLHRSGYFLRCCKQIIVAYLYDKYHDQMYDRYHDFIFEITISGKEYIYVKKGSPDLFSPDSIIKEIV
jgi:hypothetical protein